MKHTFPSIPHIITTRCVEPRESMAIAACALLVLGISMISGWAAVRALRQADPASLLR